MVARGLKHNHMKVAIQNKIRKKQLSKIFWHLYYFSPFILVIFSELLQFQYKDISSMLKFTSVVLMTVMSALSFQTSLKTIFFAGCFLPILIYHVVISFNLMAAFEEGIRYLFPIVVLLYGYTIRRHFKSLLGFFIILTLANDIWQLVNYFNWLNGADQWFYFRTESGTTYYNHTAGILRASGFLGFFGTFGFLNVIAFFLTNYYYKGKHKNLILTIMVVSVFLSFSYKAIGTFVIALFFSYGRKERLLFVGAISLLLSWTLFPTEVNSFFDNANKRIELYITEGNSARAESYRIMFDETELLGRGIGSFGGPSSTKYNSPLYDEFDFNWYKTQHLATTDTYFPHLFIEVGLIGAILYLMILTSPFFKRRFKLREYTMLWVIYLALFFDSLFSYALNNLSYLIYSLTLIFPIIYFENNVSMDSRNP